MKRFLVFLLASLTFAACELQHPVVPDNTTPPVEPDPTDPVLPDDVDPNAAACERFEELGCQSRDGRNLWEPTPGGVECPDVFRNAEKNGVNLHPSCIAKIEKCEDRHACTEKG